MLAITQARFIFKNKWITDRNVGRIETDQKERLCIEIKYTINSDRMYGKRFKSIIDLLVFNPHNYEYLENEILTLEDDLDTFLRNIEIPDEYIIFKQNRSLRLSPKFSKAIRRILTDNEKVLCEYEYYYKNRYNNKYKRYDTIDLDEYIEILRTKLTNPYALANEFQEQITTI